MKEVRVQSVRYDRRTQTPVVLLQETDGDRVLPIWIGPSEANAIAMKLEGVALQRPLTHDLFVSIMAGLGGALRRVTITRVEDSTYFAELIIDRDGDVVSIDARPSDSIALALRADARIFADDSLLVHLATESADGGTDHAEGERQRRGEELEEHLRRMRPEDLGRFDR